MNGSRPSCAWSPAPAALSFFLILLLSATSPVGAAESAPPPAGQDNAAVSAEHYIRQALASNPSLEAMRERIRMKENAALRAGALDDPKLRVGLTNVPVPSWSLRREDMTGKEIGLSQMIPWPGMRQARTDAAVREKEETVHLLEAMKVMLKAEIRMACAELASVRKQAVEVRRSREVLRDIVGVAQESYAVGRGSQPDVLRGQVEFGRMGEMLIGLENRERVLSVRLNTLAALPPDEPVPPLEELGELAVPEGKGRLMALYEAESPARKAAEARIRRGDAMIEMAYHGRHPDFEFSVSYMQRDDMPDGAGREDMVSGMVMMNLPVWRASKVDPGIREAEAEKRMAAREVENLDLETANTVGRSLSTLESRGKVAALYRTTLIPQAEQSLRATMESYRVGRVDFPMLMDAVMAVLSFRKDYATMVGELHMEKAKLEAAVGRDLEWR